MADLFDTNISSQFSDGLADAMIFTDSLTMPLMTVKDEVADALEGLESYKTPPASPYEVCTVPEYSSTNSDSSQYVNSPYSESLGIPSSYLEPPSPSMSVASPYYMNAPSPMDSSYLGVASSGYLDAPSPGLVSDVTDVPSPAPSFIVPSPCTELTPSPESTTDKISPSDKIKIPVAKNDDVRPDISYVALIAKALLSTPSQRMILADIYHYIQKNYPFYRDNNRGWKNSVRHNLSLNECFLKAGKADIGKGNYWGINPEALDDFSRGDFKNTSNRRRRRQQKRQSIYGRSPLKSAFRRDNLPTPLNSVPAYPLPLPKAPSSLHQLAEMDAQCIKREANYGEYYDQSSYQLPKPGYFQPPYQSYQPPSNCWNYPSPANVKPEQLNDFTNFYNSSPYPLPYPEYNNYQFNEPFYYGQC